MEVETLPPLITQKQLYTMSKAKKIKLPNGSVIDLYDDGAVRFDSAQSLSDAQQNTAIKNIGLPLSVQDGKLCITYNE